MIGANVQVTGLAQTEARLAATRRDLEDTSPMVKRMATKLYGNFQRNMGKGVDADGNPLAPVERWTRLAGKGAGAGKARMSGKMIPLLNTGGLRNAMNIWDLRRNSAMIGWKGRYLTVAKKQTNGTAGRMDLRGKGVKGWYSGVRSAQADGHTYARIKTSNGWRTKRVVNNRVAIKPKARKFFYLTRSQIKAANKIADGFIGKAIQK